jgi:hypothetical protein
MMDAPPSERKMDDAQIRLKLAEAAKAVADAERELKQVLSSLKAGDRSDNVMIDKTTKQAFAKLDAARVKLGELQEGMKPATDKD